MSIETGPTPEPRREYATQLLGYFATRLDDFVMNEDERAEWLDELRQRFTDTDPTNGAQLYRHYIELKRALDEAGYDERESDEGMLPEPSSVKLGEEPEASPFERASQLLREYLEAKYQGAAQFDPAREAETNELTHQLLAVDEHNAQALNNFSAAVARRLQEHLRAQREA